MSDHGVPPANPKNQVVPYDPANSPKKEVFLRTFSLENGDPDGSILAAQESFWKTYDRTRKETFDNIKVCQLKKRQLYKTADSLMQAVNDGCSCDDFVYTMRPRDRSEIMDSFTSVMLSRLVETVKLRSTDPIKCPDDEPTAEGMIRFAMFDILEAYVKWYTAPKDGDLKSVLKWYAGDIDTPLSCLRFEYKNTSIYLSDIGRKTITECGLEDGDMIHVFPRHNDLEKETIPPALKPLHEKKKAKTHRGKKSGKSKRKQKKTTKHVKSKEEVGEENARTNLRIWMDSIAPVHLEAEPLFKKKREKLNAMNLSRTLPKERSKKASKSSAVSTPINNPPTDGFQGKAGKSHFLIRVGEAENLYKTMKQSEMSTHSSEKITIIDLHGLTKDKALMQLDECLSNWVDTAMKGSYPWVIPVKIICGGGNQILAEMVENWIRQNENVSNAPKNLYS